MLYSKQELDAMGEQSFAEMKKSQPQSTHKPTIEFVQCVADAITKNVPKSAHSGEWEVVVFDSPQVNAFAMPGGKIGVYTGILHVTEDQHQLAAIMGHEVAHVIEQHSNERLSSNQLTSIGLAAADAYMTADNTENKELWMTAFGVGAQYGLLMPYSRSHESEADIVGQNLMAQSGFDPEAAISLWQNMAKLGGAAPMEFMSTHPSNQTRISDLRSHLPKAMTFYQPHQGASCTKPKVIPKSKQKQ
nr:M48 family metallopeptidase [Thalassotalea agarivorans]